MTSGHQNDLAMKMEAIDQLISIIYHFLILLLELVLILVEIKLDQCLRCKVIEHCDEAVRILRVF